MTEDIIEMVEEFNDETNIRSFGQDRRGSWELWEDLLDEEFDELKEGIVLEDEELILEEVVDIAHTAIAAGLASGADFREAFRRKNEYNQKKSGKRRQDGKLRHDVGEPKPDFSDLTGE